MDILVMSNILVMYNQQFAVSKFNCANLFTSVIHRKQLVYKYNSWRIIYQEI